MEEHDLLHIPTNICHLLSFLMLTTITAVRRYLIVILTYVSLTISDVEHFFIHLLDTCISSLGKCLLRFFAYFLIRLFVLLCILLLSCMSSLFILDIYPFSDIWFTNIFSHSVDRDHFVDNFKTVLISNITPLNQKYLRFLFYSASDRQTAYLQQLCPPKSLQVLRAQLVPGKYIHYNYNNKCATFFEKQSL